jgi:sugar/nucleoside kinase (ribokinase family)
MDKKVLSIGNATIDVFVMLPEDSSLFDKFSNRINFPLGEKLKIPEYTLALGGNACNVSVGLARLGINSSLMAEVGGDEFSEKIVNTLQSEGVDLSYVKKDHRKNPYFNIVLSYSGERTIIEEDGKLEGFGVEGEANFDLLYLTSVKKNWTNLYQDILNTIPGHSILALNPGTTQIKEGLGEEILRRTNYLFINIQEAQKILKVESADIRAILNKMKSLGPKVILLTDASNGSYSIDESGKIYQLGVVSQEKPVERTGAGDSYASGFLYAILSGKSVQDSMKYGAINAEAVIRQIGGQKGLLTGEEMEQKINESALKAVEF